jgi:hypothetical protein
MFDLSKIFEIRNEDRQPEDLKKALLNSDIPSNVAEKIVEYYFKEFESV